MIKIKYHIIAIILIVLIAGCRQEFTNVQEEKKFPLDERILQKDPGLQRSEEQPTKAAERKTKFSSEKECITYWNNIISSKVISLKSSKLFVTFTSETDINRARSILREFNLDGEAYNLFYVLFPESKPNNEDAIYSSSHQMTVIAEKNKEIETSCKLQESEYIDSVSPEVIFNFQIKR